MGLNGMEGNEMISIMENQESQPCEKEIYVNSRIQRNEVIDYIKKSPKELWQWVETNPEGVRAFSRHGDILGAILQKLKTIPNLDNFANMIKHFEADNKNILHRLSRQPWTNDQLLSIFDMLQHVMPNGSELRIEGKKRMIEFIKESIYEQWTWATNQPEAILYFANHAEVLAAVLQRLKKGHIVATKTILQQFGGEQNSILNYLALEPWNDDQIASILDVLKHEIAIPDMNFNVIAKENIIAFVKNSEEDQWNWIKLNPVAMKFFSSDTEVLISLLDKIHHFAFLNDLTFHSGNTILHLLSQAPLTELKMDLVIEFLKRGVKPDHENDEKMTFIDSSPIKARLWQKIETSPDEWCHATFKVWKKDPKVLECWINLGDDDILSGIFWRMIEYLISSGKSDETFEPIRFARIMWREKSKLPKSFNHFLIWTAKYHSNDKSKIKSLCKKYLSYKKTPDGMIEDISLPFFKAIKKYTTENPSFTHYVIKLFTSFTLITLIFRCIDAVTDYTLTYAYFNDWESLLDQYFNQTLRTVQLSNHTLSVQSFNYTGLKKMCEDDLKHKTACFIPNLKWNWLPGMFSALILFMTWLVEVITITVQIRRGDEHYANYCELFSGACCQTHRSILVYATGFFLPLTQQISSFLYEHWIHTFVQYWKDRPKEITKPGSSSKNKACSKCGKCKYAKSKACVYCSKNVQDSKKLDKLKEHSNKIADHSRTLTASTENLYMPMIQLAFLFPSILMWFSTEQESFKDSKDNPLKNPVEILQHISDHWATILIVSSTISSLISLAGSQTSIYFAAPGKRNQKTLPTRIFIFLVILLQVLPKILAFQLFTFGFIGSTLQSPDAMFFVLFFLPMVSSLWKVFMIWIASCFKLTWKMIWRLLLSPFMFTRITNPNQMASDENEEEALAENSTTIKISSCVVTENGLYHIVFDVMSLLENCLLAGVGAHTISIAEDGFRKWTFCTIVIGTNLFGLLLKCLYYQYQHPWMSLSDVYKSMKNVLTIILGILGVCLIAAMPLSVHLLEMSSTKSSIVYTIFALSLIMVRFLNEKKISFSNIYIINIFKLLSD